eukprot:TRINITY_DN22704_c0_g3_i1.p2 TRINITY_DN22704_c0_g3~~TRINITY_DN22704_c0_g3_i1.p2  ORF type:complete len:113 (+),score=43.95 TRINITY_DN22704_c0_g3_i1:467-805(+)
MEFLAELVDATKNGENRRKEIEEYRVAAAEEKARSEEYKNRLVILEEEYQEARRKLNELANELENNNKELNGLKEINEKIEEEKNVLLDLSLIHICRCRRYAVCRSRWSPYH